jgi:hypothetical protein
MNLLIVNASVILAGTVPVRSTFAGVGELLVRRPASHVVDSHLNRQRPFDRRDGQAKVSTILGLPSTQRGAPGSEKKSSFSLFDRL